MLFFSHDIMYVSVISMYIIYLSLWKLLNFDFSLKEFELGKYEESIVWNKLRLITLIHKLLHWINEPDLILEEEED